MTKKHKLLKFSCYTVNVSLSVVTNLPALLLITFRSMYNISYTLLGLLILANFITQLSVDLLCSFFSHKMNIKAAIKLTPFLTFSGFLIYALWPFLFPDNVYAGLIAGTIVFSSSGGFAEVLMNPLILSIPSKDPDRELSKMHSVYAWAVVGLVLFASLFFVLFGADNWQYLVLILMLIPLSSFISFMLTEIPDLGDGEKATDIKRLVKNKTLWLFVFAIFVGGASECTMAQWASGYLEQALRIPKAYGDIFGVALFALMQGICRTLYGKKGKNIYSVLVWSAIGATVCYFVTAITNIPVLGLISCAFTGFCVSMMWPGSLMAVTDYFPAGGVFVYAIMASGGDFGASFGPQLTGIITDIVMNNSYFVSMFEKLSLTPEQLGMKAGMLFGMIFPLIALWVYSYIRKMKKSE